MILHIRLPCHCPAVSIAWSEAQLKLCVTWELKVGLMGRNST